MTEMWRSAVDRVVVIRHTSYDAARGGVLEDELKRVGLQDACFIWTFPSPYTARFASLFRGGLSPSTFNCLMDGFYTAVKVSLSLGHDRILVCEDDVRFARDLDAVKTALDGLPGDFVTAHMSWMRRGGADVDEILSRPRAGGSWVKATGIWMRDSSAVVFSREGMEWYAGKVEEALLPSGQLYDCDMYFRPPHWPSDGSRTYVSVPLVARQVDNVGKRMSHVSFNPRYAPFLHPGGYGPY